MLFGKVVRIEDFGLGFVKQDETEEQFAFTFDKIEGYRGEQPGQLGFRLGSPVTFRLSNGLVEVVQLAEPTVSKFPQPKPRSSFEPFKLAK